MIQNYLLYMASFEKSVKVCVVVAIFKIMHNLLS